MFSSRKEQSVSWLIGHGQTDGLANQDRTVLSLGPHHLPPWILLSRLKMSEQVKFNIFLPFSFFLPLFIYPLACQLSSLWICTSHSARSLLDALTARPFPRSTSESRWKTPSTLYETSQSNELFQVLAFLKFQSEANKTCMPPYRVIFFLRF